METREIVFLKLGGSLITDKERPRTARLDVLERLAQEIRAAYAARPDLALVLGHGSGSFGHTAAREHGTRQGASSYEQWLGFAAVWREARNLNQMVVTALHDAGLPVIALPPSASVITRAGQIESWDLAPLRAALAAGLVPLVNGDTIFDRERGATILSTEELFVYLARELRPKRILLAGLEEGVWADFPACTRLLPTLTRQDFGTMAGQISGSAHIDVTGGMQEKVRIMLDLADSLPNFEALIFSGLQPGSVQRALLGETPGTRIQKS